MYLRDMCRSSRSSTRELAEPWPSVHVDRALQEGVEPSYIDEENDRWFGRRTIAEDMYSSLGFGMKLESAGPGV